MGSNLPLFERDVQPETQTTVTAGDGQTVTIPTTRDTGTISSGGLY